jgi:hypothetical protein
MGASIELAQVAELCNTSQGAKKKSQIGTFHHLEV